MILPTRTIRISIFFFQAEDGIRDLTVTGVQTCALPIFSAGATALVRNFPPEDPTLIQWILNDVAEGDPFQHLIARFSAWELPGQDLDVRSEERRVGKECRSRWSPYH